MDSRRDERVSPFIGLGVTPASPVWIKNKCPGQKERNHNDMKKALQKSGYAFNRQLLIPMLLAIFMIVLSFAFFADHDIIPGIVSLLFALLGCFGFAVSPIYFAFDTEKVVIRYLFGLKENIPWRYINSVHAVGSWGRYDRLPFYQIFYFTTEKRYFFMRGEIAGTSRTKKLMKKYYRKEIN